jgi:hypothetical protein
MPRVSIDYLKSRFETGDRPDGNDFQDLIDTLVLQSQDLGTFGNNENEITGIENVTVVDTFASNQWRWVKYLVSISKTSGGQNKFYATEISILIDGTDLNVSEYGIIDNDGDMGTISVSRSGGNIGLVVTPNQSITPITVRFARMGLKA